MLRSSLIGFLVLGALSLRPLCLALAEEDKPSLAREEVDIIQQTLYTDTQNNAVLDAYVSSSRPQVVQAELVSRPPGIFQLKEAQLITPEGKVIKPKKTIQITEQAARRTGRLRPIPVQAPQVSGQSGSGAAPLVAGAALVGASSFQSGGQAAQCDAYGNPISGKSSGLSSAGLGLGVGSLLAGSSGASRKPPQQTVQWVEPPTAGTGHFSNIAEFTCPASKQTAKPWKLQVMMTDLRNKSESRYAFSVDPRHFGGGAPPPGPSKVSVWDTLKLTGKEAKLLEAKAEKVSDNGKAGRGPVVPSGPVVHFKEGEGGEGEQEEVPPPTPEELKKGALEDLSEFLKDYPKQTDKIISDLKESLAEEKKLSDAQAKKLKEIESMGRARASESYAEDLQKAAAALKEAISHEAEAQKAKVDAHNHMIALKKAINDGQLSKIKKDIEEALKLEEKEKEGEAKEKEKKAWEGIKALRKYLGDASERVNAAKDSVDKAVAKKVESSKALESAHEKAGVQGEKDNRAKKDAKELEGWITELDDHMFRVSGQGALLGRILSGGIDVLESPLKEAEDKLLQVII